MRQQFCPLPPSPCLVTTTPPGLSPHPPPRRWAVTLFHPLLHLRSGAGGLRAGWGTEGVSGGSRGQRCCGRARSSLSTRGVPGGSATAAPSHGRGPGGVSRRVRVPVRVSQPGEGAEPAPGRSCSRASFVPSAH